MRVGFAASVLALVALSGACGGRLISTETDGQTGGGSSRGGSHAAGANNSGATATTGATGNFGASSSVGGGPSFAGTSSSSGGYVGIAGMFSDCPCPATACPPSFVPVPNPDGCCFHCESLCNQMACPGIACGSGSHIETPPGQCCPTCVQDDCAKQRAGYQDFKKQLLDKYSSYGCKTSADCTVYWDKNQCGAGCGVSVSSAAINNLDMNLQSYAQQSCSPNCPFIAPPCDVPAGPFCVNNRCQ